MFLAIFATGVIALVSDGPPDEAGWSAPVNALQARLMLMEKADSGTRLLVPYLELRYVGDLANPLKVLCSGKHVKFQLIDERGKVRNSDGGILDGPYVGPGTVTLPFDSSMR